MIVTSAKYLENLGFQVPIAVISPSHDDYVRKKMSRNRGLGIQKI